MGFVDMFKRDRESRSKSPRRSSKSDQSSRRASNASNEQSSTRLLKEGSSKSKHSQRQAPAPKALPTPKVLPAPKVPPAARTSSNKSSSAANSSVKHVEEETRGRSNQREVEEEWNEIRAPVEEGESPVVTNGDHPPNIDERQAGSEREKIETILEDERDAKIKDLEKRLAELEDYPYLFKEKEENFQMLREEHESLRRDHDVVLEDRKDLEARNERLKEQGKKLRERFDELREKDGKLEERNGKLGERNRELGEQNEESRRQNEELKAQNGKLKDEGEGFKKDYDNERRGFRSLQAEYKRLRQEFDETQETLNGQKRHITELTEVISQSGSRMVTTTRDDDYFEAEFTKLVGAIQQWVFRNFRGPSNLRPEHLHEAIRNSLDCTIWTNSGRLRLDFKVKEIQAVVADQLVRHAFYWFPFGKPDVKDIRQGFQAILGHLGGTDLQRRRWHAETVDMINGDPRCTEYYKMGVNRIVRHLKNCLDIRVTVGKEEHRDQALFALVEQAVKLAGEINREVAIFELHGLQLGGPYDPELMEDISGLLGDEVEGERGARGVVVQKLLFPMVLRYKFDDQGQLLKKDPVVVRKATVVVMRPEHIMDEDPLD